MEGNHVLPLGIQITFLDKIIIEKLENVLI